ncbi:PREDICTED: phosphatidylinositol transfer protein 1-like isoform X1 [Nicotiana attenuata]|uniref:phosphatidylinositol transfer protein 1-like isoform X1 n=1 Tax=Nicotiana attenuata TaxID=49451 RepID=UPI000905CEE2|nr:PREDICTED: phosphatidylinositol transfer protein 1-like isoform X1 [Nicotiana attenuata]
MVLIKEFRIVMPLSLEEYEIAQMYVVMKMQQQSKAPTWLTKFASPNALVVREEAWNAYPKCRSVIKCPGFSKFIMTVDTIHKADNGYSENVHGLSKQQLAARQVEIIDIASAASDYWCYIVGRSTVDLSKFKSARTDRGPLLKGWKDQCSPVMTAYKLVTIDVPYWGFGGKLEQALMAGERALFLESHRNYFAWIDEWFGLTTEMMRELERESDYSLNMKLGQPCAAERSWITPEESLIGGEKSIA